MSGGEWKCSTNGVSDLQSSAAETAQLNRGFFFKQALIILINFELNE